jgi:16S rRNA (cytosine967-C5)-methyltransferase
MKLGGRLQAAVEVLADIETRHRPVAEALKDWGVSHRFAGSTDRAAIGNIVYDTLRWRASSAWVMDSETPRALVLGTVARRWRFGAAGLTTAIADDQHAPAALAETEIDRIETRDLATAPDHIRADLPEWLAPPFEAALGPDWIAEGEALARRPPLDMRVNRLKADRAKVAKTLARFGATETPYSPDGLRIPPTEGVGRHPNVQIEPAFQKGWFEVQDEGSQVAALMVAAKPGEQILDLCAGAGGKTLALSAAMDNKGQVFATDSDRSRLAPIFDRLKRAATRNVQARPAGASLDDLAGRMDAVLIDAPCTGSGVWRRRPDTKWRLTERALNERVADQASLLAIAVRYIKPGGRLVYVTCSLLPEENTGQIATFMEQNPGFTSYPPEQLASETGLGSDLTNAVLNLAGGILLTPRRTATDGFFVGIMVKG